MSSGFNPLSMFKPTGNPVVLKLLESKSTPINELLDQQSFPTEFRREGNDVLQKYMTYKKYLTLVQYITQIGNQEDKKRAFKYPFIAAEILSIDNSHTYKYFVSPKPIIEQQIIIEEIQVEKQVDSDRSFMSEISQGSIISDESQTEKNSIGNNQIEELEEQMPEIHIGKRPSQINEDDFPFLEDIKKVKKIKQKVQKVVNHQYQPLINRLFDFFDKPFNHTLTGYVCKVINALLTKNAIYPNLLIKAQTTLFLSHLESRSVQELLVRILTFPTESQSDIIHQYNLLVLCLHKIFVSSDVLVVQNLSFLVSEVIEKISQNEIKSNHFKKLLKHIVTHNFFDKICEYFDQSVNQLEDFTSNEDETTEIKIIEARIKEFSKIVQNFVQMLMKIKQNEDFKSDYQSVSQAYEDDYNKFTESAYKRLELQALQNRNQKSRIKFGMTKIILINILFSFIKENMGFCQQILAEKHSFFEILLQLVKKSSFNNILHNSVFSIWNFLVESLKKQNENQVIIGSLFKQAFDIKSKSGLLHFSVQTFRQNQTLSITQKKGYTGHLLKIFTQIYELTNSNNDELIKKMKKTPEWKYIVSHQIEPYLERTKINLGNYIKKRDTKASIEFDKDMILQNFKEFLKGTKFTTLDEFENFNEQESDSQEEQHHHAGRVSISKETEHQIEEMQREEFEMNAGLKKDFNQKSMGDVTTDSINSHV